MIRALVILLMLVCLSRAAKAEEYVKHIILDDANLIETPRGFAMNEPSLLAKNWKTVSVNDDRVILMAPNCQLNILSKNELGMVDPQNLIANAKQTLLSVESGQVRGSRRSGSIKTFKEGGSSLVTGRNINVSNMFDSNRLRITRYDDANLSASKEGQQQASLLPDNINRLIISGDVVTFVYEDSRVDMKPAGCLKPDEQQLVQQVKLEAQQAKQRFEQQMQAMNQNMQNIHQRINSNMQNMNQRLNRDLQNMNMNLNMNLNPGNMFGRGSPFQIAPQYGFPIQGAQQQVFPFQSQHQGFPFQGGEQHGQQAYQGFIQARDFQGPAGQAGYAGGMIPWAQGVGWPFGQAHMPFW